MRHKAIHARVLHYRGLRFLGRALLWTLACAGILVGLIVLAVLALWGLAEMITTLF